MAVVFQKAVPTIIKFAISKALPLYSSLISAKHNKRNFQELGKQVKTITGILESLNENGVPVQGVVRTGVDAFTEALDSAENLLFEYSIKNKVERIFKANRLKEKFKRVHKQLKAAERHLNTALNVENLQRNQRYDGSMGAVPYQGGAVGGRSMYPSRRTVGYVEGPGFRAAEVSETIFTPDGVFGMAQIAIEIDDDGFYFYDSDDDDY